MTPSPAGRPPDRLRRPGIDHALHALWLPARGTVALWAESPAGRRRRVHDATVDPATGIVLEPFTPAPDGAHPFAVPAATLRGLLDDCGHALRWLGAAAEPDRLTLRLPTAHGWPLPSPELLTPDAVPPNTEPPDAEQVAVLRPWQVEVLRFAPAPAAQLLGELFDPYPWTAMVVAERHQHDVRLHFGASLRWLVAVHDLAWRTARSGAVQPVLLPPPGADGVACAGWRPVPRRLRAREATALAAAAPPSVLAAATGHAGHAEEVGDVPGVPSAVDVVDDVVATLADAEVRIAAADGPPLLRPGRTATPGSRTARAFVRALTSPTGELAPATTDGDAGPADLRRRLARWYRSTPWPVTGLRLGFRLVEPLGPDPDDTFGRSGDDYWRLEFTARSLAEPALVVDADRLWAGGAALAALERTVPKAEATFLDELDRAVRCWPRLGRALRDARPDRLHLDRSGALDFLRDGAPGLAEAGFEVQLPTWWQASPRLGLHLAARAATAGPGADPGTVRTRSLLDRDVVVAFAWRVALGDAVLREEELERLAEATVPLVRLRGRWSVVDREQIAAALAFLRREGTGVTTVGEVVRRGLAAGEAEPAAGGLPVTGVTADGDLGDLLAGRPPLRATAIPPSLGDRFRATLRPYQARGLAWLAACEQLGIGAVLADDMGLGKTVQTLALIVADGRGPTLLVCPTSLVGNWQHEAARFAPGLRLLVHHGADRHDTDLARAAAGADVVVTTFAIAHRDVDRLRGVGWHRLVVDEAHQVKNRATAQSRAVRSIPARHRLALTGTPVENRIADLHAVLDLVNPGLFGTPEEFKHRYSRRIEQHASTDAADELRRRVRPLLLRRVKSDPAVIADLPEKVEMTVHCTLTVEQAALYRAVVRDVLHKVAERGLPGERRRRRGVVLASLSKLKQVCNHPAQFLRDGSRVEGRSGKVARLEEILEEVLEAGERALCFTQFTAFGALLQPYLARRLDREVLFLHGGVPRGERERLVARFAADGGPPVFLLSLRAGGTGLNLTAANHVVHLDRWWNPAVEDQATDRAFRIGQRRDVQVRRLVCAGTLEERIDDVISGKRALAGLALDPGGTEAAGESWLADLPDAELARLMALTGEAVEE